MVKAKAMNASLKNFHFASVPETVDFLIKNRTNQDAPKKLATNQFFLHIIGDGLSKSGNGFFFCRDTSNNFSVEIDESVIKMLTNAVPLSFMQTSPNVYSPFQSNASFVLDMVDAVSLSGYQIRIDVSNVTPVFDAILSGFGAVDLKTGLAVKDGNIHPGTGVVANIAMPSPEQVRHNELSCGILQLFVGSTATDELRERNETISKHPVFPYAIRTADIHTRLPMLLVPNEPQAEEKMK